MDNQRVDASPSPASPSPAAPSPSARVAPAAPSRDAVPVPVPVPAAQGAPPPYPPPVFPPAPVPASLAGRLARPVGALALVAGAFAYVGTFDPNESGHYPVCPMLRFTGLFCPGCGGLRSAYAFVHGDIGVALSSNAMAVVGYAAFAVFWLLWMVRASRGRALRVDIAPAYWWGIGAVLLIFSVVRNLPFGSVLAP